MAGTLHRINDWARGLSPGAMLMLPVIAIFFVVIGIAAVIGLMTEKVYEAEARVELIVPLNEDASAIPPAQERAAALYSSEVALEATSMLGPVDGLRSASSSLADPETTDVVSQANRLRAAAMLLRRSAAMVEDDTGFMTIAHRGPQPARAADIANAFAAAFIREDARRLTGRDAASHAQLQTDLAQLQDELEAAERAMAQQMSEAEIIEHPPTAENTLAPVGDDAIAQGMRAAIEADLASVIAQRRSFENLIASGEPDRSDPVIARLEGARQALEAEHELITQRFRPEYPAARELRERMAAMDEALTREAERQARERENAVTRLKSRESGLRAQLAQLADDVDARQEAGITLAGLQRQVSEKQERYDDLLKRLTQATTDDLPTTARIIAPAQAPLLPIVPNWLLLLGRGLGLAALFSIIWWAVWKRRIRNR